MNVVLVRAWPGRHELMALTLGEGATVGDALAAAGWTAEAVAVFGTRAVPADVLREGDRIEVLRPLEVDPKQARRQRAQARPLR